MNVYYEVRAPITGVLIQDSGCEDVHLQSGAVFTLTRVPLPNSYIVEARWDGKLLRLLVDDFMANCDWLA